MKIMACCSSQFVTSYVLSINISDSVSSRNTVSQEILTNQLTKTGLEIL